MEIWVYICPVISRSQQFTAILPENLTLNVSSSAGDKEFIALKLRFQDEGQGLAPSVGTAVLFNGSPMHPKQ